jgi:Fe-S cluster assembly protein SufD
MTTRADAPPLTEETVSDLSRSLAEPEWLRRRRLDAWRAYAAMAMPTGLEEEWRRTDLSGLDIEGALAAGEGDGQRPFRLPRDVADTRGLGGLLVLQDGRVAQRWPDEAAGLAFTALADAAADPSLAPIVRERLHALVPATEWKLQALQAALRSGGAFLHVPRGVEVELPLRLVTTAAGRRLFPHLLVVAEAGSSVTLLHESLSPDRADQALVSGAVEVFAGPDARVRFYDVQRWGAGTYGFTTLRARLERGAELVTAMVGLGGRLTRARVDVSLAGEGSRAELLGLSYGRDGQHFDYITLQDHLAPRTTSDLLFKAALDDRASQVWYGTVRIHKGASASDANQTSRNLLLSDSAKAAPIPVLEIEAYDILRCSHGATAGPLDEDQLFYLESRGIDPAAAERLLVEAFFRQVLDRLPDAKLRGRVEKALARKMGSGGGRP